MNREIDYYCRKCGKQFKATQGSRVTLCYHCRLAIRKEASAKGGRRGRGHSVHDR